MKTFKLYLVFFLMLTSCTSSEKMDLIPLYDGETFVYIDKKGKVLKPSVKVKETSVFRGKYALVSVNSDQGNGKSINAIGKGYAFGFLNRKGELEIPAEYFDATVFSEGIAWVVKANSYPVAINEKGKEMFSMPKAAKVRCFREGLAAFSRIREDGTELWGFIDKKGEIIIEPSFSVVGDFSNGLAYASFDELFGYINKKGEMTIKEQFYSAQKFTSDGYAIVSLANERTGVINKEGSYQINPKYYSIISDGDNFLVSTDGKKSGFVNVEDEMIIPQDFNDLIPFFNSKFTGATMDGEKWGVIDSKGKMIINPQFDFIAPFYNGMAVVKISDKFGIIDNSGKYVINPIYENSSVDIITAIFGESRPSIVETDFFNTEEIVDEFIQFTQKNAFRGIDKTFTYSDLKNQFPNISTPYRFNSSLRQFNDRINLSSDVYISRINFNFLNPLTKNEYNYYTRKYESFEINETRISSIEYEIRFNEEKISTRKKESLINFLLTKIENQYLATVTSDSKGGLLLNNQELEFNLNFSQSRYIIKINYLNH
ncbi:hypothetical protein M2459_000355 [Parabacteroides sp. PF5-5]|uniref:WG repeat-containing protein n=1 Tax=unclassified Parabacteroides TaxID=2649774 RepID=UPI002474724E|nr:MULTISPECIES: WG repeat-containing protein [unclassified Parabacteroides]MDH6306368.1 hypothetical protein [Parabacteroides sp. PH5-39]MDH6314640.1 hypothetical protein [Parabacteroides sp. PF5-13]MDH6321079.1 hypothetical protein [Parabacteroides sp. PH5-13]MDH6324811.1 hypothetical protein [Parabacteroides sp. PH5-8]MDH6325508.1 hypothetical protein [Parabacteroides sp. PH5-41]